MTPKTLITIIIAVAGLILLNGSFYTVSEGQRALVLRLGEIVQDSKTNKAKVEKPGLHFKLPFINSVRYFDVRLQTLDVESSRILTAEQKYVLVDYYAKWRIHNIPLYYTRTGGYSVRAQNLLKQKINDSLRAAFGRRTIKEVIATERTNIMGLLNKRANKSAESLGIEVTDVRIRGIELPRQVREAVYQRMRTEREQVATRLRSQGMAKAEAIRADTDAKYAITVAQARANAQRIRASGDSEAAKIYTDAYNRNPKFYAFYRSLQAYQQVFTNKDTVMVLKPNGDFFKYFNHIQPRVKSAQ